MVNNHFSYLYLCLKNSATLLCYHLAFNLKSGSLKGQFMFIPTLPSFPQHQLLWNTTENILKKSVFGSYNEEKITKISNILFCVLQKMQVHDV